MESFVARELWNKAPLSNARYTVYTGDDYTTTYTNCEKRDGKTYETNVGLNLQLGQEETAVDPLEINDTISEDQRYEMLVPIF